MASGQVQFKALVLIALIFGATAEECVCKDEGYEISYWRYYVEKICEAKQRPAGGGLSGLFQILSTVGPIAFHPYPYLYPTHFQFNVPKILEYLGLKHTDDTEYLNAICNFPRKA